ncbi:hypothetical protein DOY81_009262, partial [Sarcophaga bullata]
GANDAVQSELIDIKQRILTLENKLVKTPQTIIKTENYELEPSVRCKANSLETITETVDLNCFGKNWIVVQRRTDGSENFNRVWNDYKHGFGNISNEFFLGLEKLHQMTSSQPHELLIVLEDFDESKRYAKYDLFEIGTEAEQYELKTLGSYQGNAGDSLSYHKGSKFSTPDRDNDQQPVMNCAEKFQSAWWFKACHESNLNGCYRDTNLRDPKIAVACGIHWRTFRGQWYSLKSVEIMIRLK